MALPSALLRKAFDEPLHDAGFVRVARRQVWIREADDIHHAVSLEAGRGRWRVTWDLVHPRMGEILHGRLVKPAVVALSAVHQEPDAAELVRQVDGTLTDRSGLVGDRLRRLEAAAGHP